MVAYLVRKFVCVLKNALHLCVKNNSTLNFNNEASTLIYCIFNF